VEIICSLLSLYLFVLMARAILSWFPVSYDSPVKKIRDAIDVVTEPVLSPLRNVIPPLQFGSGMGLDMSFMVVVFGIIIFQSALCS